MADRLTDLLEAKGIRLVRSIDGDDIMFLRGGARKAALDWGCQRWSVNFYQAGSKVMSLIHSGDSLTDCARKACLELHPKGSREWEAFCATRAESLAEKSS